MFFVFQILANFVFNIMGYLMHDDLWKKSPQRCQKWKNFEICLSTQKDIAFLNLNFPPFWAIFSNKNGGKLNFQSAIFWMDWLVYLKNFFTFDILVVTSFRNHHYISHNTKTKFGGNSVTSFSRQKSQNLKNEKHTFFWNGDFYIVAKFQVNCVKTYKR